ncbi:MAG TPA: S8 family serine peptidase [Haliangiales bacterium]|nr:S8 family serine peptidase [Haliangiales bacterium]
MRRRILVLLLAAGCAGDGQSTPDSADARPAADASTTVPDAPPGLVEQPFAVADVAPAFNPLFGIDTSPRFLLTAKASGASADAFLAALGSSGCHVAGMFARAGVALLDCGEASTVEVVDAAYMTLRSAAAVAVIAPDLSIAQTRLPPSDAPPDRWFDGTQWAFNNIDAPAAWNLNRRIADALVGRPPPVVGIVDAPMLMSPDLEGILETAPGGTDPHGTAVAGIIGANFFNKKLLEGVAPFVTLVAEGVDLRFPNLYQSNELGALQALLNGVRRPRVVNLSLGFTISSSCSSYPDGMGGVVWERCDPRIDPSQRVPDGRRCDPMTMQALMADGAVLIARIVAAAQLDGPILFVHSAGNDSGPMLLEGESFCRSRGKCGGAGQPSCPPKGLGNFPSALHSDLAWAAQDPTLGVADDIIVVEALTPGAARLTDPAVRAASSNVDGGGVFAPGDQITVLDPDSSDGMSLAHGTSFAAPFVAGAAAFLLAIEPTLTNAELRTLLTARPYAAAQDGGGSTTSARLNLLFAVAGLDVVRPRTPAILEWMTDFDDGTADGFTRDGSPPSDAEGDGVVDMRDFRRLRDMMTMQGTMTVLGDDLHDPRLDLNQDGRSEVELDVAGNFGVDIVHEVYARGAFTSRLRLFADNAHKVTFLDRQADSLDLLAGQFVSRPPQPWSASDLPGLLASADLHVSKSDIERVKAAYAVPSVTIVAIEGDAVAGDPQPTTLAPLTNLRLDGSDDVVLTTPLRNNIVVRWAPSCPTPQPALEVKVTIGNLDRNADANVRLYTNDCVASCAGPPPDGCTRYDYDFDTQYLDSGGDTHYTAVVAYFEPPFKPGGVVFHAERDMVNSQPATHVHQHQHETEYYVFTNQPGCMFTHTATQSGEQSGATMQPPPQTTTACSDMFPDASTHTAGDCCYGDDHWGFDGVPYMHVYQPGLQPPTFPGVPMTLRHECRGPKCAARILGPSGWRYFDPSRPPDAQHVCTVADWCDRYVIDLGAWTQ